jgi:predicted dehydrogenase
LKIAMVGCGALAEIYYAPVVQELQADGLAEMSVLCDPDVSRLKKLRTPFAMAAAKNRIEEVVAAKPDLAIVASPPRFHAEQTIALLDAGISVLCEKPMAATVPEAEAMIAAAEKASVPMAIGLFRRFFPVNRTIRDLVRNGNLGAVRRFEISEGGAFQWPAQSASFFQKSASQGGVLADVGVHVLDLILWWFGMPERVRYEDDAMGGLEANCRMELSFPGGVSGTVRLSRDTALQNQTVIEFERGWVRCAAAAANEMEIGFAGAEFAVAGQVRKTEGPRAPHSLPGDSSHQSFARQLRSFLVAVRGEGPVEVPGPEGIRSLRLIESCYRQRTLMEMPWLSPGEKAHASALAQSVAEP